MTKKYLFAILLGFVFWIFSSTQTVFAQTQQTVNFDGESINVPYSAARNRYINKGLIIDSWTSHSNVYPHDLINRTYRQRVQTGDSANKNFSIADRSAISNAQCASLIAGRFAHSWDAAHQGMVLEFSNSGGATKVTNYLKFNIVNSNGVPVMIKAFNHAGSEIGSFLVPDPNLNGACRTKNVAIFSQDNIHRVVIYKNANGQTGGYGIDNIIFNQVTDPVSGGGSSIGSFSAEGESYCSATNQPYNRITWTRPSGPVQYYTGSASTSDGWPAGFLIGETGQVWNHYGVVSGQAYTYQIGAVGPIGGGGSNAQPITVRTRDCSQVEPPQETTYRLRIVPTSINNMRRNTTQSLQGIPEVCSGTSCSPATSGVGVINWQVTNNLGAFAPSSGANTVFTSTSDCSVLDQENTGSITARTTISGNNVEGSILASIVKCGANVIGDVGSLEGVSNITVDDRSVVSSGSSISIDGQAVRIPDYNINWGSFRSSQENAINRLIPERAESLSDQCLSGDFNLNPRGASNPSGGLFERQGDLTICGDTAFSGKGTIVVRGNVVFQNNTKYNLTYNNPETDMLGMIIDGDMTIPAGSKIIGAYFVKGTARIEGRAQD